MITGCAHPGIVKIVRRARELENDDLHLVMGGFHLGGASDKELRNIVESFRELFGEEYGENYLPDGAVSILHVAMTSLQGIAPEEN